MGSILVLVVYNPNRLNNPKFNIVAFFYSNYDVTTSNYFLNFFMNLLVTYFSRVALKSIDFK
jgi:hypothetical protein